MKVFRLAAATHAKTRAEAFSGKGGLQASGRWHTVGRPVIYTAQSLSLAALEILVHLKQTNDIQPFHAFAAEVPDDLIFKPASYPAQWQSKLTLTQAFGDRWLEGKSSPALLVPTAITPGEWNVLLNPMHPKFSADWIVDGPNRHAFDARLLRMR